MMIERTLPNGTVIKYPIQEEQEIAPQPSSMDIAEETLLETKYQTILLEMML